MSINKGKDVVGNSDFDVNQLNQVVQDVNLDSNDQGGWAVSSKWNKNKGGNVAAAIQAPTLNPLVQPAGRGGAPVRPPTNVWANPAGGRGGAVNYNPTPTAILPPLSRWNWNSRPNHPARRADMEIPQPPAVEEDVVDESDDDYDDDDDDASDDEVLSDEYDSDEKPKSHEERKKNKWHAEFFITLDKLSVEQINKPDRQWHCPACKNGPGAIDWYKSLPSLVTHAKTEWTKRVKIHRDLAELLEEELRIRGALVVPAAESYGKRKGLKEVVKDKKIVWPPSVVIMNTRVEQDENERWLGMGNQELLDYFGSYQAVRARDAYGPRGHRGMSLLIFETSAVGYTEAERLSKHFEDLGSDRDAWEHRPQLFYPAGKRQLYGYMATKRDMEIFNMHSQGKSKLKFEMVSYQEKVVDQLKQMNEDNQQLIWNKNKVAKEQMPSKALKELFGLVSQKPRKTEEENRQVTERTKLLHDQNKEEMCINKGKDVVGNSDFDVNQLNQVVQDVNLDSNDQGGWAVSSKWNKNKGGNVAAAIQAPTLNPLVQPAGQGGAPVRPPTNVWANPAGGRGGAVNYNPTPTAILPPLSRWNWNSRPNHPARRADMEIPQPPAVEEDVVDESDDDYDDDDDDASDDEVLSDEYDSDEKPKSHEERKKNKWHAEFFITLDKLSVEQINQPDRQWHCPACKNGPGAIDWYKSLPSLVTHAKTEWTKRVKIHRDLAELLEEELRIRGALVVPAAESYGKRKGLKEVVKDKKIVWPPSVVIMNTRVEQDENDRWLGMGNQELLDYFGSYQAVRARDAYGPRGHRGMSLLIFETSAVGYTEAERLSKHFEDLGSDRDAWEHRPQLFYPAGKRQLYGYMATKRDMEIFNMHSQGKSKLKFEMVSYQEKVVDQLKQMNEDNQQLIWNKNKVAKEQMPSKALKELFGLVSQKPRKTEEENRQVTERTKLLHDQNKEEMSINKGKDVVGNSDFDVNQLNQVVQDVNLDSNDQGGWAVSSKWNKNKGGNVAAAIQAPTLNPLVQPAGRGGAPVRPPTNVWANPAGGRGGAVNYNPTPTAILPPLSRWNWNSRPNHPARRADMEIPQPPAVEEDVVDESDDDYDDDDDDASDDEVLSDEYDSDEKPKSHEERKKNKWHAEFFITLDKLSVEQINEPDRQWHCPACKIGPGAIDWYKSLPSLVTHAKTEWTKRVKIHRDLAELLEEELRIRGGII